jgi:capsular polysaccharide transport system ATP-binding protein
MIIVSHNAAFIREHCSRATVLAGGKLHNFESIDEALAFHDAGQSA